MPTIASESSHGIAFFLLQSKLLKNEQIIEYNALAQQTGQSLLYYLVTAKYFSAKELALAIAQHFNLPFFDLSQLHFEGLPLDLLSKPLIQLHRVLPIFKKESYLYLATDDPSQPEIFREIQFYTSLPLKLLVVETDKLYRLIEKVFYRENEQQLLQQLKHTTTNPLAFSQKNREDLTASEEDEPIIKYINQLLLEAANKQVSDIHFEPYEFHYRIRYRLDGLLMEVANPPEYFANRITARIKVMARLDIAERRLPQDGHFKLKITEKNFVDFRVSTCPTLYGEKIVIRLLDTHHTALDIETLGLSPLQKTQLLTALQNPQGMILVTGPTGSGKTITLYTALQLLNTSEKNILTAEDPVEIKLPGINQMNINPKANLTFSTLLRAFLRQDPDVIMVGEIRDRETAEVAIKAAHTGHLVLSTLHTNSAIEAISRLINIGIPSYNIPGAIQLLIAQRLVRTLCNHCKKKDETCLAEWGVHNEELTSIQLYKASGCQHCYKGYLGRIGIFEVLPLSKQIGELIIAGSSTTSLLKKAQQEGMKTLYQSGLRLVKQGLTTIEEIKKVINN